MTHDELVDALRELVNNWEKQAKRSVTGSRSAFGMCASQLRTLLPTQQNPEGGQGDG